jgi:hypothetical protein
MKGLVICHVNPAIIQPENDDIAMVDPLTEMALAYYSPLRTGYTQGNKTQASYTRETRPFQYRMLYPAQ